MLGHKLLQRLSIGHEVWGTVRQTLDQVPPIPGIGPEWLIGEVSATDLPAIGQAVERVQPDAVLNCIGIVKQIDAAKDAVTSITINALLPHQLGTLCEQAGARLIHFSTDCVFSGRAGPYQESDQADATDLYGRSKLLGEVDRPGCLTIRTSIVGRELRRGTGLFEWFFAQRGKEVRGYRHALYTGLTTQAMADVVRMILEFQPGLSGIWQVSADPIDKCSLLELVNEVYALGIRIVPDETFHCDRRLDSRHFRTITGWNPSTWQAMVEAMHADPLL
jgi:dTDP-4-dehydrorhamnose reductase